MIDDTPSYQIKDATIVDISARELWALFKIRGDVFTVEQQVTVPEIDEFDGLPETRHVWLEIVGEVAAVLRVLKDEVNNDIIGRVATAKPYRGHGYAGKLIEYVLENSSSPVIKLGAQAHLENWYKKFGFKRNGPTYMDADIIHIPMVLER
ncbi:MAG: GNAT family N-acetyltransferase [Micrococcaceae bacterium]